MIKYFVILLTAELSVTLDTAGDPVVTMIHDLFKAKDDAEPLYNEIYHNFTSDVNANANDSPELKRYLNILRPHFEKMIAKYHELHCRDPYDIERKIMSKIKKRIIEVRTVFGILKNVDIKSLDGKIKIFRKIITNVKQKYEEFINNPPYVMREKFMNRNDRLEINF
uniref:Uncharacterized protein n=1 Tax=Clastoptera arizonana TaxID=38151 RepID=A0A1B6EB60_9HEMI